MHKVLRLRARRGDGAYGQMRRANRTEDQLPVREGMKAPYYDFPKYAEDYKGPMKRWLRSQVGRPWNDAYSELCRVIKPDTRSRVLILKRIQDTEQMGFSGYGAFYVDLESGLLCELRCEPEQEKIPAHQREWRWLTEDFVLLKREGEWKLCQLKSWPADSSAKRYDHLYERGMQLRQLLPFYRKQVYCVLSRPLSKAERKRFGLVNQSAVKARSSSHPSDLKSALSCLSSRWPSSLGSSLQNCTDGCDSHTGFQFTMDHAAGAQRFMNTTREMPVMVGGLIRRQSSADSTVVPVTSCRPMKNHLPPSSRRT
jgi:hypothetical protein